MDRRYHRAYHVIMAVDKRVEMSSLNLILGLMLIWWVLAALR